MSPLQFEPLPPVPAVSLARKLKSTPMFRYASVDELFRISEIARQVRYSENATVSERGSPAEYIQILLQGKLRVEGSSSRIVEPPAMLGFQEALKGTTLQESAQAVVESVALVLRAEEFRALLSANIELAQGLLRMLLDPSEGESLALSKTDPSQAFRYEHRASPLKTVEKAMLLQTIPIFSRATGEEIYQLAAIAREIAIDPETTLFESGADASIVLVLEGELRVGSSESERVGAGRSLGVRETLAGSAWSRTSNVERAGKVLQIDREPLFELLADRLELLQGIFSAIFRERSGEPGR